MHRFLSGMLVVLVVVALVVVARHAFAADDKTLQPGTAAPDFSLPSQDGTPVTLSTYRGKWVVLYFYPKDQTPGCTIEAHNFQRDQAKFDALNAVILGISLDTVASHQQWCTKDGMTFKMLADPDHKVVDLYGVGLMMHGVLNFAKRTTFLISPSGVVTKVWIVSDVNQHSDEVQAEIAAEQKK
jgi:peroxiredoxin Q/BCP